MKKTRFCLFHGGACGSKTNRPSRRVLAAERLEDRSLLTVMPLAWPAAGPQLAADVSSANAAQPAAQYAAVGPDSIITTVAGTGTAGFSGEGGLATKAKLNQPKGVAVDDKGDIFIADTGNNLVRKVLPNGKIHVLLDPANHSPVGLAVDRAGTVLYIAQQQSQVIHKIDLRTGELSPYAGGGTGRGDGGPATDAALNLPTNLALDKNGDLYITEGGSLFPADRIRKVDHETHIITTIVDGDFMTSGHSLNNIGSVAVDDNLNIFFASGTTIYKAGPAGVTRPEDVVVVFGDPGGEYGNSVRAIAVNPAGDTVYCSDDDQILAIQSGAVSAIVGDGTQGFNGDGLPAIQTQLNTPRGIALDLGGNLYFADSNNNRIRTTKPVPGPATKLVFSAMPTGIVAGVPFQVVVTAQDDHGNIATKAKGTVTLSLTDDHAEETELGGKLRVNVVNGVAKFSVTLTNGTPQGPMSSSPYYELQADTKRFHAVSDKFGVIGYTPAQIRKFYGLDKLAPIRDKRDDKMKALDGTGQTIAIVVAYHHPNLYADVDAFDQKFGLKSSGKTLYEQYGAASTFLTVHNGDDLATPLPGPDPGDPTANPPRPAGFWEREEIMDVQWAHAIAPGAKILVLEAADSGGLYRAIDAAGDHPGVSVVSMSFGSLESDLARLYGADFETITDATTFTKNGVTFVSGSGDWGAPGLYPAYSPNVVAVGGTTLSAYFGTEKGWDKSGGGESQYEAEPLYQRTKQKTTKRTIPDVSFLADIQTPAAVYNSYLKEGGDPWEQGGGTSLGTPAWAGIFAIVNQGRVAWNLPTLNTDLNGQPFPTEANEGLYSLSSKDFRKPIDPYTNDRAVNGTTKNNLLNPGIYDEVTGLGSPKANRLIPGLMEFNSHKRTRLTVASNSRALSGPAIEAVALACLAQSNSSLPSANLIVVDRSPLAAINGDASRFGGNGPAPVPLLETIQDATPKVVSTSRKLRSRFADGLFGAALDEIAFGRTLRDGEVAAALLAAGPVRSGTRDAALAEIADES